MNAPANPAAFTELHGATERFLIAGDTQTHGIDYAAMFERTSQWAKTSAAHGPAIRKSEQRDSFNAPYIGGRL